MMFHKINQTLLELENQKDIKILYAAESGSRAWGVASPDSDYDCRFIYKKRKENYLRINEEQDYIELPVDKVYDVNGWDLKKVLKAALKSNATIFEWLQSPIIYREEEGFRKELLELYASYFNEKAVLYHYKNIASNKLKDIMNNEMETPKKYFYVLRPLFACEYIMKNHSVPPMTFESLYDKDFVDERIQKEIERLLELKSIQDEKFKVPQSWILITYLEELLTKIDTYLMQENSSWKREDKQLNEFFLRWIERTF